MNTYDRAIKARDAGYPQYINPAGGTMVICQHCVAIAREQVKNGLLSHEDLKIVHILVKKYDRSFEVEYPQVCMDLLVGNNEKHAYTAFPTENWIVIPTMEQLAKLVNVELPDYETLLLKFII